MSSSSTAAVRARPWNPLPSSSPATAPSSPTRASISSPEPISRARSSSSSTTRPRGVPAYPERVAAVAAAGAAAVIGIIGKELPWPVVQRVYDAGQKRLGTHAPPPLAGAMSRPAAESVIRASGAELAALLATPAGCLQAGSAQAARQLRSRNRRSRRSRPTTWSAGCAAPAAAARPCSTSRIGTISASARRRQQDKICNGAVDNASGIAALLEIARALGRGPRPKRDICSSPRPPRRWACSAPNISPRARPFRSARSSPRSTWTRWPSRPKGSRWP